jgi:hypothetical protein
MELATERRAVTLSPMSHRRRLIVGMGGLAVWLALAIRVSGQPGDEPQAVRAKTTMAQRVSELIRAELPFAEPLPPATEEASLDAAPAELKDGTLHLPTMTVRQQMKAPLRSTDWLTGQGRMELALKRFPGTRIGNIFGLNNPWAWERLTEGIEAERHAALKERGQRLLIEGTAEDRQDQKLLAAALMYSGRPAPK